MNIADRKAAEAAPRPAVNTSTTAGLSGVGNSMLNASRDRTAPFRGVLNTSSTDTRDEFTYSLLDNSAFVRARREELDGTAQVLQDTITEGEVMTIVAAAHQALHLCRYIGSASLSPIQGEHAKTLDKNERMSKAK